MVESFSGNWIEIGLLALIGFCQLAMLAIVFLATRDLRRTSQKASHNLELTRQLLTRANRSMQEVEGVLHKACGVVSQTVEQFLFLKGKAKTFLTQRFGNGAKGKFHRQYNR